MAKAKRSPRQAAPDAPPRLSGGIDRADADGTIEGWCWSPDEPDAAREVALLVDGQEVARFLSDQEREDLRAAGIGNGQFSFLYCLDPDAIRPGAAHDVALVDLRTGQQVATARINADAPAPQVAPQAVAEPLQGNLDRVSRDGWVSGWCWYPDRPDRRVELSILVDDQEVGAVTASAYRPDLEQAGIGDGRHGFSFALPYSALADRGLLTIAVRDARTGQALADPITVRLGRMAAAEERIEDLERQLRLLRGQIEDMTRAAAAREEERAARALFGTVAAFFQQLAEAPSGDLSIVGGIGLSGALDALADRLAPLTLAWAEQPVATVCLLATADAATIHACLAALHDTGIDRAADIVLLDDGGAGGEPALLPSLVRNLRYVRLHDRAAGGLLAGCNDLARDARGDVLAFLAPQALPTAGWLDEIRATFAAEPEAAVVTGRLLRPDGLLQHAGLLADDHGALRDVGHLADPDASAFRFLRRIDAVSGAALVIRRAALLAAGGFSPLYTRFGHAVADLCARLRGAGQTSLFQPLATALWTERGPAPHAEPPDLKRGDEETLRLRERLRQEGWPAGPAAARFVGRALVIDDHLPRPDHDAGSIATFEQMLLLRRLGWRVTFCPAQSDAVAGAEADRLARRGVEVIGPPRMPSLTRLLETEGETFDLVHVYRYANAAMLMERIRALAPRARVVFATADLHFLREARRAELAGTQPVERVRDDELACMRAADATIITSDHERAVLRDESIPRLTLLRWIDRVVPTSHGFADRRDMCFVGNFRHGPNLDGVTWFLAEVFPRVREKLPGLKLRIAGSAMPAQLAALAGDGVELLGWVENLAGLFDSVRLSVAPLRYGAGFKGKVANSLAHGLPVVGSSVSLEGTGLADGDGVLIADDPAEFAAHIVRLHEDSVLWADLSRRAQAKVEELFSPRAAEAVWRRLLAELELPARA